MAEAQKSTLTGNGGKTAGGGDVEREMAELKADIAKLTEDVQRLASAAGNRAMRGMRAQTARARRNLDSAMSDASGVADEAVEAVKEVRDDLADAIEDTVYKRPFTTLALTLGLGFLLGAAWRR